MGEDYSQRLKEYIEKTYEINALVNLLDMKIKDIEMGKAILTMKISAQKHTNLYKVVHGGALASLADTVMGVVCATVGKRVITLDMNMNYIKNIGPGETAIAVGRILHNGNKTMVVEAELFNESDNLLVKARATFFVTGRFEDLPHA